MAVCTPAAHFREMSSSPCPRGRTTTDLVLGTRSNSIELNKGVQKPEQRVGRQKKPGFLIKCLRNKNFLLFSFLTIMLGF